MIKFYNKQFKLKQDKSIYLANIEPVLEYDHKMLQKLSSAADMDMLLEVKREVLRDYREIYEYDLVHAPFPEPFGHFDSEDEKDELIKRKILLQDFALYPATIFKLYHKALYERSGKLPMIECSKLAIDYGELYKKALEDYVQTIVGSQMHAVAASFILPTLIEQGLGMALQNRMLFYGLAEILLRIRNNALTQILDSEENELINVFFNRQSMVFMATEEHVMGSVFDLFVREGILEPSNENRMILTGRGGKLRKTLGSLIYSEFAQKEIYSEYLELLKDMFDVQRLNIRNRIMHGTEDTFDYLSIGIVSVMFQLLWDIGELGIFKA